MSLGPHASLGAPGSLNRNMSIHEGVGAQGEYKEGVQGVLEDSAVIQCIWPTIRGLPPVLNEVKQMRSDTGYICHGS